MNENSKIFGNIGLTNDSATWSVVMSRNVASLLTIRSASREQTTTKFVNARYSILTPHKTWPTNVINEYCENQPYASRTLCPVSEITLCYGSLVLQESKTLCFTKEPYAVAALCCREVKTFCLSLTDQPSQSLEYSISIIIMRGMALYDCEVL